jgi:hypothetical protein
MGGSGHWEACAVVVDLAAGHHTPQTPSTRQITSPLPPTPHKAPDQTTQASFHSSPYTGWQPLRRSTLDPKSSEDSSAPRRQLDGGVPPAADGRGGGQTHPWQRACPRRPCCGAVLVVARPDGVGPQERPAGIQRSGVVAVVDPASSQATGVGRRCPAGGAHPSGVGVRGPAVWCLVTLGSSSRASGGRPSAVHPSSVQPSTVQPCGVQPSGVGPVGPDASVSSTSGGGVGIRSRRPGRGPRCPSRVGPWEVGGRWRTGPPGWVGAAAAALAR